MPADPGAVAPGAKRRLVSLWRVSFGDAALAAFVLCAISGALLVPGFDAADGARSIAEWLLANPGATFLRNLHYWTAQAFLVLTLLHGWDHLRRGTEARLTRGVWLRLVASLPVLAFLMLSGFLLRADADAQQARRIFEEVVRLVPLAGPLLATFLFGTDEASLQVVYLHHAATATLIVWLVIVDHARRRWGTPRAWLLAAVGAGVLALLVSPGLHDGRDPVVKGPWYFLGLQELLHWTPWPLLAVGLSAAVLVFIWWMPRWTPPVAARTKRGLFAGHRRLFRAVRAGAVHARRELEPAGRRPCVASRPGRPAGRPAAGARGHRHPHRHAAADPGPPRRLHGLSRRDDRLQPGAPDAGHRLRQLSPRQQPDAGQAACPRRHGAGAGQSGRRGPDVRAVGLSCRPGAAGGALDHGHLRRRHRHQPQGVRRR